MSNFNNDLVLQLPDITKIEFKKIDKSYFKVILINFFLFFIPLLVGLIVLHQFVFNDKVNNFITFIYLGFLGIFTLFFFI